LLGDYNLQNILKIYLSLTPNIYKKIFRLKQNTKTTSHLEHKSDRTANIQQPLKISA
jgi:hypothetical protein